MGSQEAGSGEVRTEIVSHADTCVVRTDIALEIHDFDQSVRVHAYDGSFDRTTRRMISAVVAYDHPVNGETFYLVIHQAILMPQMSVNLLSSMQM
mmetsp:Transcript_22939/g.32829  ORF Transcript_22939/g.32829 Transcript_22939/m.32829 type:complete len:95 (+) Transcript_22939:1961-2245(+)